MTYLGPGSAGHYVKIVHNGLEYGLMELIAESYDLMKRGLRLTDDAMEKVYLKWNETELNSYLIEITTKIFGKVDDQTGKHLLDEILDEARQKGTGKWSSQDAMDLQVPVPSIDIAVAVRDLSANKTEREKAGHALTGPMVTFQGKTEDFIERLHGALYAGMIICFAQGLMLLRAASSSYQYHLDLEAIARIWRGGCIIRAALLEKIREAILATPDLPSLLLDVKLGGEVDQRQDDLRFVIEQAVQMGIPVPGFMVALSYFDGYRSEWLPANLIQAQRDYFGAHTYERLDGKGVFHTVWEEDNFKMTNKDITPNPGILIIFGAGGDLPWRKLFLRCITCS